MWYASQFHSFIGILILNPIVKNKPEGDPKMSNNNSFAHFQNQKKFHQSTRNW